MENKNIIIILGAIAVVLAVVASLFMFNVNLLDPYRDVDEGFIHAPKSEEKVRFTGTYLGPDSGIYNVDQSRGVMQVGHSYVIINTDKVQGREGQAVTLEGYFVKDDKPTTVPINNNYVSGRNFCIENVVK